MKHLLSTCSHVVQHQGTGRYLLVTDMSAHCWCRMCMSCLMLVQLHERKRNIQAFSGVVYTNKVRPAHSHTQVTYIHKHSAHLSSPQM